MGTGGVQREQRCLKPFEKQQHQQEGLAAAGIRAGWVRGIPQPLVALLGGVTVLHFVSGRRRRLCPQPRFPVLKVEGTDSLRDLWVGVAQSRNSPCALPPYHTWLLRQFPVAQFVYMYFFSSLKNPHSPPQQHSRALCALSLLLVLFWFFCILCVLGTGSAVGGLQVYT